MFDTKIETTPEVLQRAVNETLINWGYDKYAVGTIQRIKKELEPVEKSFNKLKEEVAELQSVKVEIQKEINDLIGKKENLLQEFKQIKELTNQFKSIINEKESEVIGILEQVREEKIQEIRNMFKDIAEQEQAKLSYKETLNNNLKKSQELYNKVNDLHASIVENYWDKDEMEYVMNQLKKIGLAFEVKRRADKDLDRAARVVEETSNSKIDLKDIKLPKERVKDLLNRENINEMGE